MKHADAQIYLLTGIEKSGFSLPSARRIDSREAIFARPRGSLALEE